MSLLALLPSPLLGSQVWAAVATLIEARGQAVVSVDLGEQAPTCAADVVGAFLRGLPRAQDLVLVPHSNAGLYVPALIAARSVSSVVFVDAALPPTAGGSAPTASAEFRQFLADKADAQGLLPVWTDWWDEDLSPLFPNPEVRAAVEGQQKRLPLSYFEDSVPVPAGWHQRACSYLAFGTTYQAQAAAAAELGWPVSVLDGEHLEMTVHPTAVTEQILALLGCG